MIGTIDVKVQAHNPNFPLDPVFTFVNSSQSFRIRDVPKRIGNWSITNVFVNITYPDNTVISKECLLVGGVWVGTVNGCSSSGQVEKGFVVTASGIDENNQTVSNYVLGAGDIYVKQLDGTVTPGKTSIRMFFYETIPTSPNEGDSTFIEGVLNVYDGTQWKPVAQQSDPSYIEDSNGNKIEADGSCLYTAPVSEAWKAVNLRGNEFILEWNSSTNKFEYELPLQHRIYLYYDDGTSYWELEDSFYDSETGEWCGAGDTVMDGSADSTVLVFEMLGFTCTRPVIKQDNLARVSQIPTKTSDLTNDSGFITSTQIEPLVEPIIANKRDLLDMNVRGTPTNEGSWFNISDGTYMENAHWYDGTRWMTGATFEVDKTSTTGVFELKQFVDGSLISLCTFSLDDKYEATLTVDDVTYTIVGYVDIIATQSWVRNLIQTMLQQ